MTAVETLERFLHRTYLGQKRFSIEGLDVLVPMLDLTIELAGVAGARRVVMGMAHRGRLNVLAHVVGLPYETIFAEFEGGRHVEETLTPAGGTGDVKYHHGADGVYQTAAGKPVNITLTPNPSHLEAVNPVVEGRARAGQTNRRGKDALHDGTVALPVLIHGDASFAAQGVVAETFNLARLKGYTTGGTIHLITNNQLGFTTDSKEARSTDYASDLAKGFDVPIVHVNADDPEACLAAVQLAMMFRARFHGDVVIDIVGYRRYGHNEGDEPAYTQPLMYERIREAPTVRQRYLEHLTALAVVDPERAEADAKQLSQRMSEIQQALRAHLTLDVKGEEPQRISGGQQLVAEPDTRAAAQLLTGLNDQLLTVPAGFTINPKLKKQLERRRTALTVAEIEWAHAEALALATLVHEGVAVRLTGQDTARGTFSQRHMELHDAVTGERYAPIQHLPGARAPFELHNSPLSEFACLGFEYGYAAAAPDTLVLWEAQYGDFFNVAEVIIDQFLIAGSRKMGSDVTAHAAAAARLRRTGAGALERADRAVPGARRRRQHAHRQLLDARTVLPSVAPPGAAHRDAPAGACSRPRACCGCTRRRRGSTSSRTARSARCWTTSPSGTAAMPCAGSCCAAERSTTTWSCPRRAKRRLTSPSRASSCYTRSRRSSWPSWWDVTRTLRKSYGCKKSPATWGRRSS